MKICYLSMSCNQATFETIVRLSKKKPSIAPQVFDNLLIEGLSTQPDINDIEIHSFPMVGSYPGGCWFSWGPIKERLKSGLTTTWLPAINLQLLKPWCFMVSAYLALWKWAKCNRHEPNKVIITYSIYGPIAIAILAIGRQFGIKTVAIVPDIPSFMFEIRKPSGLKAFFTRYLVDISVAVQDQFDGYVLLTEEMNQKVNDRSQYYTVVEGIADPDVFQQEESRQKPPKKSIMYAGALNKKLGIAMILEAFAALKGDEYELWICGSGDYEEKVREAAYLDPRIIFHGRVDRSTVLELEQTAWLLLNVRSSLDEFTRYSFPSKTLEYMASGTPLLTTRLRGIPEEYFEYVYALDNETSWALTDRLIEILSKPLSELTNLGRKSQSFVATYKTPQLQAKKVVDLIRHIMVQV